MEKINKIWVNLEKSQMIQEDHHNAQTTGRKLHEHVILAALPALLQQTPQNGRINFPAPRRWRFFICLILQLSATIALNTD